MGTQDHYDDFPKSMQDQLQVLSFAALEGSCEAVRAANNELAAACKANPTRLAAFAKLPIENIDASVKEFRRCVVEHGFKGALVDNHYEGAFFDDEKFWPLFSCAEELDVAIYLHPTFAAEKDMHHYQGNFSSKAALAMSAFAWSWHTETGLHFLRLWASGLFDKHPRLKLILGHMGEMLPFQMDRIVASSSRWGDSKRSLQTVWNENVWVTTSGMFSLSPLSCLIRQCAKDRILYSIDYPFSQTETGLNFIKKIQAEKLFSEEDFKAFCGKNAQKLLKL